ncbi:MAG: hypothetical protein ACR2HR_08740 [Euzebya sp.]
MQWRRQPNDDPVDPHGVADLLSRACAEVTKGPIEGTRFLFGTAEMLRVSREIEQSTIVQPGGTLYVGTQSHEHLERQSDVYHTLLDAGVRVVAHGTDHGTSIPGITWVQVPDDAMSLAASWFLVRSGDSPHALVGFELAPVEGDADGEEPFPRLWEGFETRDGVMVAGIIVYLEGLNQRGVPGEIRDSAGDAA